MNIETFKAKRLKLKVVKNCFISLIPFIFFYKSVKMNKNIRCMRMLAIFRLYNVQPEDGQHLGPKHVVVLYI